MYETVEGSKCAFHILPSRLDFFGKSFATEGICQLISWCFDEICCCLFSWLSPMIIIVLRYRKPDCSTCKDMNNISLRNKMKFTWKKPN